MKKLLFAGYRLDSLGNAVSVFAQNNSSDEGGARPGSRNCLESRDRINKIQGPGHASWQYIRRS